MRVEQEGTGYVKWKRWKIIRIFKCMCVYLKIVGIGGRVKLNVRQRLDLISKKYQWNSSFTIYVYDIWAHAI